MLTVPRELPLAISFREEPSLEFGLDETHTLHYTITGGNDNNVVKAEMQNVGEAGDYSIYITTESATTGQIEIRSAKFPTTNRVIVTVSDGRRTIMAAIDVRLRVLPGEYTIVVPNPGDLKSMILNNTESSPLGFRREDVIRLTVLGTLNESDISCLSNHYFPNITTLNLGNANMEDGTIRIFSSNEYITSFILPSTLKSIGNNCFYDWTALPQITVPQNVESIGNYAFHGCTALTRIDLPTSLTTIGIGAFKGCTQLQEITIPENVTSIGISFVSNCTALENIYVLPTTPPRFQDIQFFDGFPNCTILVPQASVEAYKAATVWNQFASQIVGGNF